MEESEGESDDEGEIRLVDSKRKEPEAGAAAAAGGGLQAPLSAPLVEAAIDLAVRASCGLVLAALQGLSLPFFLIIAMASSLGMFLRAMLAGLGSPASRPQYMFCTFGFSTACLPPAHGAQECQGVRLL